MSDEEYRKRVSLLSYLWHRPQHEVEEILNSGKVGYSQVSDLVTIAVLNAGESGKELYYWLYPAENEERKQINRRNEILQRHTQLLQTLPPNTDAYRNAVAAMKQDLDEFDNHGTQ